jgi:heme oxygenase (biliverdin-producing, ferredoxin)
MSLRDLTKEAHTNAERQEFVKILFSGNIDPKLYATFLKNQHPCYELLEVCAMVHGLLSDLPDIRRAPYILNDFMELWGADNKEAPKTCPTVQRYLDHIMSIKTDPKKLMAHLYVRHMGDLAGGQMIAKRVPGNGRMYQFENPEELKTAIRAKISDDMADEAIICFDFATRMFKEMLEIANDFK